jgi:Ca2+-binding EF-hand superfamily protein
MSFVNDGDEDCDGGEDEDTTDGSDNGGDNGEDQDSEDDGPSPQDLLDITDTDQNGLMDFDEFITSMSESDEEETGESMPQSVIDEFEQMFKVSDLDESGDLDLDELEQFILDLTDYLDDDSGSDDDSMMWTFHRDMSECDDDADGMVDFDELDGCVTMDLANDGYGDEGVDGLRYMFDLVDADEDGMLDSDEFEDFAEMTSGEPMMVCYDRYADEIDSSVTSEEDCEAADFNWIQALQPVNEGEDDSEEDEFMCNDGSTIPMSFVNDGEEDCDGGEDEDDMGGSDHDHGDSDGDTFYIETSQDVMIPFEGDMSDYKIELTTCRDDYNPDTMGYDTTCGESVMSIAISDAGENSDIMFHDTDNSGTISVGDMIHIGETTGEWNTVRLYSISADAYSDENPIYNTPGFTGLVGMLALLGAAFIRRNE